MVADRKPGDPPIGETQVRKVSPLALGVAQKKAAMAGALYDHVLGDLVMLLGVVDTFPLQEASSPDTPKNVELVEFLRRKYGQVSGTRAFAKED